MSSNSSSGGSLEERVKRLEEEVELLKTSVRELSEKLRESQQAGDKRLTIKDFEAAVYVVNTFLSKVRSVEQRLRLMRPYAAASRPLGLEGLIQQTLASKLQAGGGEEEQVEELSLEDLPEDVRASVEKWRQQNLAEQEKKRLVGELRR